MLRNSKSVFVYDGLNFTEVVVWAIWIE
jgi:hypothetical protein